MRIQFFEQPGIEMTQAMQKEVEKHFTRGELRRVAADEVGTISYPARVRETYASDLLADARRERDARRAASGSSSTTATPPRPTCCRSCSARSVWRSSPRTPSRARATAPRSTLAASVGAGEAARAGDRRRSRRGLRPRGRAALPRRRARAARCRSSRRSCSTSGCSASAGSQRQARVPGHRARARSTG